MALMNAVGVNMPTNAQELLALKRRVFWVEVMGGADPDMPPGMDPKKWLNMLKNAVTWGENYLKDLGNPPNPAQP